MKTVKYDEFLIEILDFCKQFEKMVPPIEQHTNNSKNKQNHN